MHARVPGGVCVRRHGAGLTVSGARRALDTQTQYLEGHHAMIGTFWGHLEISYGREVVVRCGLGLFVCKGVF
jgi:hypothetical protein